MPKTATKTKKTAEPIETTVDAPTVNAVLDDFNTNGKQPETVGEMIAITSLEPSPTNPRKRFPDESIAELAGSIKEQGVIEPLVVRLNYQSTEDDRRAPFEIVCGERRYRASLVAGLDKLPCIVRDLTDEQVLDIQIHENLHREDVHPMDEAYGYQFLMEKLGCDVKEVALRVGKPVEYVLNRLKLNDLIDDAQKDIEDGHLPLGHALFIAKYAPNSQKDILANAYVNDSKWVGNKQVFTPIKTKPAALVELKQWTERHVHLSLEKAPFDIKATNLRSDGLACINCPTRTGAEGLLFKGLTGKKDNCLDQKCYDAKSIALIQVTREGLAMKAKVPVDDIPKIYISRWQGDKGELGRDDVTIIGKKPRDYYYSSGYSEKRCDLITKAVSVKEDTTYGSTLEVCTKSSGCKIHWPEAKPQPKAKPLSADQQAAAIAKQREAELIKKRERREELVDVRVGNAVRAQVFRLAVEKFNTSFTIDGGGKDLMPLALAKMWTHNGSDDSNTKQKIVRPILASMMDVNESEISFGSYEREDAARKIAKLSPSNQNRLFFLLVHGNSGSMYYERYESQKRIREMAEEYGVNYRLIDAEERLKWAEEKAKKHIPAFKLYLDAVRAGDAKAKIPRPYAETYKPRD